MSRATITRAAALAGLAMFASACSYFEIAEPPDRDTVAADGATAESAAGTNTTSDTAGSETTVDTESASDEGESEVAPEFTIDDGTTDTELAPTLWPGLPLTLELIAEYEVPIALEARSGTDDLYVAQKNGIIRRISRTFTNNGTERISTDTRVVLDISDQVSSGNEQGLLDIEFSIDGRNLYVSYTDLSGDNLIMEYSVDRATRADLDSARELYRVPQPAGNHNGGAIEVGDDGFLYFAIGDGGGSGDPEGNGQDIDNVLGTIVRIDPFPDGNRPYSIPDGNPFVGTEGDDHIWLYGVRNPWRISFDSLTGDLWVADVGQNEFEEITLLKRSEEFGRGANLGWNVFEGFQPFDGGTEPDDHIRPTYAYAHDQGRCSITGGHVYRGEEISLLNGVYLFGDWCTGEIFGMEFKSDGIAVRPLTISVGKEELVSFGVDEFGEMWVVQASGQVSRIIPTPLEEEE